MCEKQVKFATGPRRGLRRLRTLIIDLGSY